MRMQWMRRQRGALEAVAAAVLLVLAAGPAAAADRFSQADVELGGFPDADTGTGSADAGILAIGGDVETGVLSESAQASATSRFGSLDASASVDLSTLEDHADGSAHAFASFSDSFVLSNAGLDGLGDTFQVLFDLGGPFGVDPVGAATDALVSADYVVTIELGASTLVWTGSTLDSSALGPMLLETSVLTIDGALQPGALPDALPGDGFTTPALPFTWGEAIDLAVSLDVLATAGSADPSDALLADLASSFRWGGLLLGAPASITSESGSDWTQAVPEPGSVLLLGAAVLAFAARRRR